MSADARRGFLTIGEVVERLLNAYPDLTISKVRFLEEEGLIAPERTPGGYRTFRDSDVQRLELVLRLQREHFLPLAVIRDKLADIDRGKIPAELRSDPGATDTAPLPFDDVTPVPLTAVAAMGLPVTFIRELEGFGLVTVAQGPEGDMLQRADLEVAHVCWDLRRFGMEPRHLRMFESSADRAAQLFAQILMPLRRHKTAESAQKLEESVTELTRLSGELDRLLMRRAVDRVFDGTS